MHPADDALEVQDDVGDIFLDAPDRRELVGDALDADAGYGCAGERGQQHAPQRVAKGVAEAPIERLDRERASVLVDTLVGDSWDLEVEHQGPNVVGSCRRLGGFRRRAPPYRKGTRPKLSVTSSTARRSAAPAPARRFPAAPAC